METKFGIDRKNETGKKKESKVQSPCHHGRECYTSVNQSIKQAINQSIDETSIQSINLSVPWHFEYTQSINQSINQVTIIPKWVSSSVLKLFRVFIVFCTCRGISFGYVGWDEGRCDWDARAKRLTKGIKYVDDEKCVAVPPGVFAVFEADIAEITRLGVLEEHGEALALQIVRCEFDASQFQGVPRQPVRRKVFPLRHQLLEVVVVHQLLHGNVGQSRVAITAGKNGKKMKKSFWKIEKPKNFVQREKRKIFPLLE